MSRARSSFVCLALGAALTTTAAMAGEAGLVGYWDFESSQGAPATADTPAWGVSPSHPTLPQPLAFWDFETSGGVAVSNGTPLLGEVDETAGHPAGPLTGAAIVPTDLVGTNYSADTPPALASSSFSIEVDESNGDQSFGVPMPAVLGSLPQGDFTIHVWFQTEDVGRGVMCGTYGAGLPNLGLELHTSNRLRIYIQGPTATTDLNVSLDAFGDSRDGQWHSAAAVREGGTVRIFYDGQVVGEKEDTAGAYPLEMDTYYFGRDYRVGSTQFSGRLDDIAFWNVALNDEEVGSLGTGTPAGDALLPSPVLLYRFETKEGSPVEDGQSAEGQVDESSGDPGGPYHGVGSSGAPEGSPTPEFDVDCVPGSSGSRHALRFTEANGEFSSVDLGMPTPLAELTLGDFTLHAWFQTRDEGRGVILGCYDGAFLPGVMNLELHTDNRIRLYVNGPSGTTDLNVSVSSIGDARDGQWHVATAVREGDTARLYFDGLFAGETADSAGSFVMTPDNFYMARDSRTGSTQFDGRLDQVAIWDEALSLEEIEALAQGRVDAAAGPSGLGTGAPPFEGELADGINYSADTPPLLASSTHSIEVDEANGDESFSIDMVPAIADLPTGDFTLHTWFKTTDTGRGGFFGSCCGFLPGALNFELHTDNRLRVWIAGPPATTDLNVSVSDVGNSRDGRWHAATAIRRGDTVELYYDGLLVGTKADTAGSFSQAGPRYYFGRDDRVGSTQFSGKLDDIAMWNVALSVAEIEALAGGTSPIDASIPAPIIHFGFETSGGAAVEDGQSGVGQVDESGVNGEVAGPFHAIGVGEGVEGPADGLNFTDDVPDVLTHSTHSLELDELNGDEAFKVSMSEALSSIPTGDFTFHTWFQTRDTERAVFCGSYGLGLPNLNFELHTSNRLRIYIDGPVATTDLNASLEAFGNSRDGEWHSAAAVRAGGAVYVYYDGQLVAEKEDVAGAYALDMPAYCVGRDFRTGGTQFSGKLDDLAIWSGALSATQIQALAAGAIPTDMTPCPTLAPPSALVATAGDAQVALDWEDSAEGDLTGYTVYRSLFATEDFAPIAESVAGSEYLDTTAQNGTTYYYFVTATDTCETESAATEVVEATPELPDLPPAAPTGLFATAGNREVALDWDDSPEDDFSSYNVYRGPAVDGPFDLISTSLTVSEYVDPAAANNETYFYLVTAVDLASQESVRSSVVSATPNAPPAPPVGLSATAGDGQVSLDWEDNTETDLASYTVYRSETSGGPYSVVAAEVTESEWVDSTAANDVTVHYVVTAIDVLEVESEPSNEASATPTPPGGLQVPGDSNGDGNLDLSDAVRLLSILFIDNTITPPCEGAFNEGGNLASLDFNADTKVDLSDAVGVLNYLFTGGSPHALGIECTRIAGCPDVCAP